MSNAAKVQIPTTGDNGKTIVYDEANDEWDLSSGAPALASDLTAHLNDTADAHDASAISFTSVTGFTSTDVQAAIEEARSDAAAFVTAHEAAGDPHPGYLTTAEGNAAYWPLSTDLATQAELDAHIAAADPHPGYLTPAEGNAAYWPLSTDLATQAELDAHASDTTSIHGIADTSVLATDSDVASAITTHEGDTDPHGDRAYADSLAANYETAGAVAAHEADTTSVHGIADTSALLNTTNAPEIIRDTIGAALVAGTNITLTVNDGADTITIAASGGSGSFSFDNDQAWLAAQMWG